jgi:hypothetical protein
MIKKVIILLLLSITTPQYSKAAFHVSSISLTIIVNSTDGSGNFNFFAHGKNSSGFNPLPDAQAQVSLTNGQSSTQMVLRLNDYLLYEKYQPEWNVKSILCNGGSASFFQPTNDGIELLNLTDGDNITCIFTNISSRPASKTPVLIIPGVLGTDIKKGNDLLWANLKMSFGFDGFMDPLQFNSDLTPLDTSLTIDSVIREKTFLGISSDYTNGLINELKNQGYTEGKDLFTFPYDWRFGVSEDIVNQLKGQVDYILNQTEAGVAVGKVDIVAHSTGGLIVKKYVSEHPSDHHIEKAVFVGVPNLGAPKALKVLTQGDDFDVFGFDPSEMKKIGKNMPIVYDLAPTQEYYNQAGSFFHITNPLASPEDHEKDLNFVDTMQNLVNNGYANQQAVDNSKNLHSNSFDSYDLRNEGVDLYNIVGCKMGTFGKFSAFINKESAPTFDFPKMTSGDATVPFISADSLPVDGDKTYFAPKIRHGDLLSSNGSRQQITNILTGSTLDTNGKILTHNTVQQDPKQCEIKGESLSIHSPVDVGVIDQLGNFSGIGEDGSIQNNIPGADYEVWGEHKYVFLPTDENQQYTINLKGTGTGTYTIKDQSIEGDAVTQTQVFSNLPVTPALAGQVLLGNGETSDRLSIMATPTSTPELITPTTILNTEQSADITPPMSTSTTSGIMGQPGFYRSDVKITITATDPIIPGQAGITSGILQTHYSLDNGAYQDYSSTTPITTISEGSHVLKYFSTDRAGNNEEEQTLTFMIDKTAPEAVIKFVPSIKDIQFNGVDNFSSSTQVSVLDQGNSATLTDQAGNTTVITMQNKNRKNALKADITSISYNGTVAVTAKDTLHYDWQLDKKGNVILLTQHAQSKKEFNINAVYFAGKTILSGKDQTGRIFTALNGLILLKTTTNRGDIGWGY